MRRVRLVGTLRVLLAVVDTQCELLLSNKVDIRPIKRFDGPQPITWLVSTLPRCLYISCTTPSTALLYLLRSTLLGLQTAACAHRVLELPDPARPTP